MGKKSYFSHRIQPQKHQDGSVVCWGHPSHGGNASALSDRLRGVTALQATDGAFAARTAQGHVVTWGAATHGGDSGEVEEKLRKVTRHFDHFSESEVLEQFSGW